MKIAVISDIHDNIWNLHKALNTNALQATEALLCCGDLCSPFIVRLLGQGYAKPIHLVLGNNDGDLPAIIRTVSEFTNIQIHGEYFKGDFAGRSIAMNHYPDQARILAQSGAFDVVCYGHNHLLSADEMVGETLMINPGAIMGYNGGELKEIRPTFIILNTTSRKAEIYEV